MPSVLCSAEEEDARARASSAPDLGPDSDDPDHVAAARGARVLECTGELWPSGGKWRRALAAIGRKPEGECERVAETIRASSTFRSDFGNPQHVLDHWHLYAKGKEPGSAPPPRETRKPEVIVPVRKVLNP